VRFSYYVIRIMTMIEKLDNTFLNMFDHVLFVSTIFILPKYLASEILSHHTLFDFIRLGPFWEWRTRYFWVRMELLRHRCASNIEDLLTHTSE